jgi:hypothetical protein
MKNRTYPATGRMRGTCPSCCIDSETGRTLGTSGHLALWTDTGGEERMGDPVWICNNCDHETPRRPRRTKGEMALAWVRAQPSYKAWKESMDEGGAA